jgi:hypothetical protein
MKMLFRKTILAKGLLRLFALVAALGLAVMPLVSASAAGEGQISNERLERVWARQLRLYERMGRTDDFVERVQKLIDRASQNGKDVSAVQAALDAFKAAVKDAQPMYESAKSIINSHPGFDENGKVTDPETAQETVTDMRAKLNEMRDAVDGTRKVLHEAIKSFRKANPRPQPTSTS